MRLVETVRHFLRASLSRKFVLAVMLVNIALIGLLGWELIGSERARMDHARIAEAEHIAGLLAVGAASPAARGDGAELQRLAEAARSTARVESVAFADDSGRILARAGDAAAVAAAPRGTADAGARLLARSDTAFVVDAPIRQGNATIGRARVEVTRADDLAAQRELALLALPYGAAVVLLGGLVAFLTARSVTERLARLAKVADRFRLGDRDVRFRDDRPDEVGSVSRGINAMLDTIADTERSLREVFRIARIGSWRYVPSERRLQWSDTVAQIFDEPADGPGMSAEKFMELLSAAQRRRIGRLLQADEPGPAYGFNFTVAKADGTRAICWAEARAETCPETGERVLAGVCQDVTERETAIAQLRQAQKMEAVGQLTGGLAHDFNNLLAIIIGNLDLLEQEFVAAPDARESVEEALAAALRGSELTRQLLAFSRRQPLSPRKIDLNRLIADASSLWRRTLGESIEVEVHLAETLWATRADPTQVESAVLNLVINARDAMPGGGMLTVETGNVSIDEEGWDDGGEIRPGDYSVVSVSDNGQGMPPDVVARAFDPFFTTKAVGAGSGLGLSMIYGFATQSGGTVRIYSEPGQGTTVRLYLPRATITGAAAEAPEEAPPAPPAASETILLVEDNEGVRRIAERQLRDLGYEVVTAATGPEALALLDEGQEVDLLFTDVVMPGGMNGFELAQLAMQRNPQLKVLHTSGFTRPAGHGAEAGAGPVLMAKPYRKIDLALKLRQVLEAPAEKPGDTPIE